MGRWHSPEGSHFFRINTLTLCLSSAMSISEGISAAEATPILPTHHASRQDGKAPASLTDGRLLGSPPLQLSLAIAAGGAAAEPPSAAYSWSLICQQRAKMVYNCGQGMSPLHCRGPGTEGTTELLCPLLGSLSASCRQSWGLSPEPRWQKGRHLTCISPPEGTPGTAAGL